MNPQKSFKPGLTRLLLTALCGSLLAALPAQAQITIVNDDNSTFTNVVPNPGGPESLNVTPWTVSFDAGATADKLIVALSSETGSGGPPVITYNGAPLTLVPGTASIKNKGIWYLDTPFTGGLADLVIDMTSYATVNGIGFGVVSVSGAAPGSSGGNAAAGLEVSISTTIADSLIVSAYSSNSGGVPTVPVGDIQLYTSGNIGSADGAAAYRNLVAIGSQTVTYGQTGTLSENITSAAVFVPASAAPAIVSTVPAGNSSSVALGANLVATFSEPVIPGTGDIELWQVGGGSPVESFNVLPLSSQLTFSGQTLTINPTSNLTPGVEYYVLIPATAVVDTSGGDAFAGISDPATWSFIIGQIWDGGDAADANWTSVLNWQTDVSPNFAKPITFEGATRITNQNDRTADAVVGGINFINDGTTFANAFTLQGIDATTTNSMTLGGDITTTASSSAISDLMHRSLDVILNGNRTITTDTNHNLRIDGQISETGGSWSITKEGAGQLTFGNNSLTTNRNSFSGGLDINNGAVSLVGSAALGTAAAGTGTINLGATSGSNAAELRLAGSGMNPTNALVVRTGSSGTKTLANRTTNSVIYKGIITANDNLTILAANGGGRLTVDAAGSSVADGKTVAFSNTGTGATMINSATWGGQGSISYTSSSTMGFEVRGDNTYSGGTTLGAMSGTGILIPTTSSTGPANAPDNGPFGTGTLTLGDTQMRGGNTANITIGNPVIFSDNPTFTTVASEKSLIFSGDASLGATRTLTVETGSTVPGESVEFSGAISGSTFGITKEGAGTLRLSGNNSYTGATNVSTGTLSLAGGSQASPITVNASASIEFTLGATTTSSSSVALGGTVKISGTPTLASYTLMTASGGFTGTPTLDVAIPNYVIVVDGTSLKLNTTITDPYILWSGGAAFDADSNNDGVKNGLAWLLGAPNKDANALGLLPKVSQSGGGLIMKFTCLKIAGRGTSTLSLQHSGDLGLTDPWASVAVPDAATTVGTVVFTVPTTNADPNLVDLEATIPVSEALSGKLFGRLIGGTP